MAIVVGAALSFPLAALVSVLCLAGFMKALARRATIKLPQQSGHRDHSVLERYVRRHRDCWVSNPAERPDF
jgi:hypothetical protein